MNVIRDTYRLSDLRKEMSPERFELWLRVFKALFPRTDSIHWNDALIRLEIAGDVDEPRYQPRSCGLTGPGETNRWCRDCPTRMFCGHF